MESRKTATDRWRAGRGVLLLAALIIMLRGIGWWRDHRTQTNKADALRAEADHLAALAPIDNLRAENEDLIRFIDEAYALLQREGIHVQRDLDVDKDGRYRLRATAAELVDELKAKLRELKGQPARQP